MEAVSWRSEISCAIEAPIATNGGVKCQCRYPQTTKIPAVLSSKRKWGDRSNGFYVSAFILNCQLGFGGTGWFSLLVFHRFCVFMSWDLTVWNVWVLIISFKTFNFVIPLHMELTSLQPLQYLSISIFITLDRSIQKWSACRMVKVARSTRFWWQTSLVHFLLSWAPA